MKVKTRHELNDRIINNFDQLKVKYNPAEHIHCDEILHYYNGWLYREDHTSDENIKVMEVDSVYIDEIEFIGNNSN